MSANSSRTCREGTGQDAPVRLRHDGVHARREGRLFLCVASIACESDDSLPEGEPLALFGLANNARCGEAIEDGHLSAMSDASVRERREAEHEARTHLDVHQDAVDSAAGLLPQQVESFLSVACEEDVLAPLLDELLAQNCAIDEVVLPRARIAVSLWSDE